MHFNQEALELAVDEWMGCSAVYECKKIIAAYYSALPASTAMVEDAEREAFEKWAPTSPYRFNLEPSNIDDKPYAYSATQFAWSAWKARAARVVRDTPVTPPEDDLNEYVPPCPDIEPIRRIARDCGYAVGVHGSLQRDFDLIAIPWVDAAAAPDELVERLCEGLNAITIGDVEDKPLGRKAVIIQIKDVWAKHIDLSIAPIPDRSCTAPVTSPGEPANRKAVESLRDLIWDINQNEQIPLERIREICIMAEGVLSGRKQAAEPVAADEAMVERVARAICEADANSPDPDAPILIGMKSAKAWEGRIDMAKAAIAAMAPAPRQGEKQMRDALSAIARMKKDGENGFDLTNDDAVDSLHSCIELARVALASREAA